MKDTKSGAAHTGRRVTWSKKSIAVGEMKTPLGTITIAVGPKGLLRIDLPGTRPAGRRSIVARGYEGLPVEAEDARVAEVKRQLGEYFEGRRRRFQLPLDPQGTDFDRAVWRQVGKVGYSQVATYGDVARAIGRPAAFRAVGAANGRNPLPIVVPCHRIVGSCGRLTGYGGGLSLKARLLRGEGVQLSTETVSAATKVVT